MLNLELPEDLYVKFRDLLLNRCGLDYPASKCADLLHSLTRTLQATGLDSLHTLYVQAATDQQIWETLIHHVTIGETYFFRNTPQFNALRQHILPEILTRRVEGRGLRCWSAGCATGEEPYSLAMTIRDLLPSHADWHVSILASDINREFLARAREGLYSAWAFRETPPTLRERYFTPEGKRWRMQPEIRRMVRFIHLNLAEPSYPSINNGTSALDLILCRNVTIYFDAATTRRVVERLYQALAPGGWLIVGHAEPQISVYQQFEVHNFPDTIIYRKALNAPLFTLDAQVGSFSAGSTPLPAADPRPAPFKAAPPKQRESAPAPPAADPSAQDLLRLARQSADRGEWTAADQQCRRALERDPLCRDAHYLLAQMHESRGEFDAALAAYRRAVYLDRRFVPGLIGLANVWLALGRSVEARRSLRNALKQLALLPPTGEVPHADGLTNADLIELVQRQLRSLDPAT